MKSNRIAATAGKVLKDDYIIYSDNRDIESLLNRDCYFIVGLDPAIRNFAVGIEERNENEPPRYVTLFKFSLFGKTVEHSNMTLSSFTKRMDQYQEWWPHIGLVIIERQLQGKKSYQIYQHAISYFLFHCPEAIVLDVNPKLKGRILLAPKNLNYTGLKKWAIQTGIELLKERKDQFALQQLANGKRDDMCDVVCEIEAFMRYISLVIQNNSF
jgi:hypothetical protein